MPKVKEVEAGFCVGGQIQVKKFDIQATYEYSASKRIELEDGDDPDEVINDTIDGLKKKLLEPKGQEDFESLWEQRLKNEKSKKD
jgi:hypothetical protein